jgi:bleomycin hydrolase
LRRGGIKIREISDLDKMRTEKSKILADVYRVLSITLGEPPQKFNWSYRDNKKRIHKFSGSPLDFAKQFDIANVSQKYVMLRDTPTLDYGKIYCDRDDDVLVGDRGPWLNIEFAKFRPLILNQLRKKEGVVVYIVSGRDITSTNQGVMDPQAYDFANLFGVNFDISRENRKRSHENTEDHAVLIIGADAPHGVARWYKIENSWGDKIGDKGFWAMSSAWADEYMSGAVIRRDLLPDEIANAINQKPIALDPWGEYGE